MWIATLVGVARCSLPLVGLASIGSDSVRTGAYIAAKKDVAAVAVEMRLTKGELEKKETKKKTTTGF